jgi:hypothetical protein
MLRRKWVVVVDWGPSGPTSDWQSMMQSSMGICSNFAAAYRLARSIGNITEPDLGYRRILKMAMTTGAVRFNQKEGDQSATIIKVKVYS